MNLSILAKRTIPPPRESTEFPYYLAYFLRELQNKWTPQRPNGSLILSVAENALSLDILQAKIKKCPELPDALFGYDEGGAGKMSLKRVLVDLLESTFLPGHNLDPNNIAVASGASAILESLFFTILDPGDGVIIPVPFYGGYKLCVGYRCQGTVVPVDLAYDGDVVSQLDEIRRESASRRVKVRAMVVTNPGNPTGTIIPESTLTAIAEWCADNSVHLIANEVYANSIFCHEPVAFESLFSVAKRLGRKELQNRLHLVYGISKDFCASGLRLGLIYTEAEEVLQRMHVIAYALKDQDFVQSFLTENVRRLKESYETLTAALEKDGIPFMKAQAGLFVWIDCRSISSFPDFAAEKALCGKLADAGILITPGGACSAPTPGFFRICYATVPSSALPLAVERIKKTLKM